MAVDVSAIIAAEVVPALNAAVEADLVCWTPTELYQWADESLKRLARTAAVFVSRSISVAVTSRVTLAAGHLATVHAAFDGSALRSATVRELEALDPTWETASAIPKRYVQDLGTESVRLYPAAAIAGTLVHISQELPPEVTAASPSSAVPTPMAGYILHSILVGARAREGDGRMPEVAEHCSEMQKLYERVAQAYWGSAQ